MKTSRIPRKAFACLLLAGSCIPGMQGAVAADLDTTLSASIGRSDNIFRTEEDPVEETISTVGVALDFLQTGRRGSADIDINADYVSYRDDAFDNELIGGARVFADYFLVEEVLDWDLQFNYGQQVSNPLVAVTPDNREDVTYLTTGPNLELDLGERFVFGARAEYSTMDYEVTPNDNTRTGYRASIGRRISEGRMLSLVGSVDEVDYDLVDSTADYDRQRVFLRFESFNSRGSLTVEAGVNEIDQEGSSEKQDGTLFVVDWVRDLAAGIQVSLGAGSRYSDQGDIFRFFRNTRSDLRATEDVAGIATPFRNDFATARFRIDRSRTNVNIVAIYSDEDYEEASDFNREVTQLRLSVGRQFVLFRRDRMPLRHLRRTT